MSILLSLLAAMAYGLSDFLGGIASRRTSAWPVAVLACSGALLGSLVLALALPGSPTGTDLLWGLLAGLGSGVGSAFLYRGFALGRMGVVAPVSAVGAAVLPVVAGLLGGEEPSLLVTLGLLVGLPGIWLVSREPGAEGAVTDRAAGVRDGLVAGTGFGLLFAGMGQVPEGHGYWPLVVNQTVSVLAVVIIATVLRQDWRPRALSDGLGLVAGLLAAMAVVAFLLATQGGLLVVAAVLTSFYPAVTVLLATLLLRERVHAGQAFGLLLCAVTVGLVAAG